MKAMFSDTGHENKMILWLQLREINRPTDEGAGISWWWWAVAHAYRAQISSRTPHFVYNMTLHAPTYKVTGTGLPDPVHSIHRKARDDSLGVNAIGYGCYPTPLPAEAEEGGGAVNQEFGNLFSSLESLNSLLVTWEGQIDALWDIELWIYGRLNPADVPIPGQPVG
ncbi:hypothetical protein P691DRAFT_773066 [Macrolepiota fuliginosa MF-IS2]|uniref:Uncharacterized protein n=1 Tax=Macrolepiota fuliginosa MF-IS2 TaxID=1400762 RepID=A0A9P5XJI2_9AGAR|nr:hypothetical protein P691DRAFT_773066 [Macrolepiota fuliginosa MF-IS2]